MLSFRQKIFFSYLLVFLLLIAVMFPFASHSVKRIVNQSIRDRTSELILKIREAPNNEVLLQRLRDQKSLIFFRVSIITNERKVLYDSYTKRLLGSRFDRELVVNHPEVEQAFKEGVGFFEGDSKLLDQRFFYVAQAFDFHDKPYVLRAAFPYKFVSEMTRDLEFGFIGLSMVVLLLFSFMTWFIINRLTRPIQQIITAIKPYQEGIITTLPEIRIGHDRPFDDFGKLADTLNSLSDKIQKHIDSLTQEVEMRKDFIANASHELKTPVTIIRGFAETLHDYPEMPRSTYVTITSKIVRNCQRMTVLIKDLLSLTDIENLSHSRKIECDLLDLIQTCSQMLRDLFPDAIITINKASEEDISCIADPNLIEMAIMNLLENAAKYSQGAAQIIITLQKEGDWIKLSMADQGIGIPASDLKHIFQRFYTVNKAHSRTLGGSGLGLSLVETIVQKHFGKISVESTFGQGSTFTILLPFAPTV